MLLTTFKDKLSSHPVILLLAAYLAGGSSAMAFAPYNLWWLYPIALGFTLWLMPTHNVKAALSYWFSFGFGAFSIGISWVHVSIEKYGGMPLIASLALMSLLALYLALYPALVGGLLQILSRQNDYWRYLALFPALWTLTEWLRGWMLTGFPWLWAGYSQADGPLQPLASVIGTIGLSFVIAFVAGTIVLALSKRWLPLFTSSIILMLATLITPSINPVVPKDEQTKVALVQGNIAQDMKWQPDHLWPTLLKYMDMTQPILDNDIIIWPEAAIPAPETMVSDFLVETNQIASTHNAAIVSGIISYQQGEFYNALIVLGNHYGKQQSSGEYRGDGTNEFRKHQLLPIGEFVPFGDLLRPLAPLFNLPMSSFARGDYAQPNLSAQGYKLAPAICYEIAFPEQLRANVHNNTDMIVTVSNDSWFGASNGPLQHMQIAQMRAVELGRPVLRATNNGVTAVVDYKGKIIASLPQFKSGVLTAEVPLADGITWFNKLGQWPVLFLSIVLVALSIARRLRLEILTNKKLR